jgi:CBS domain-containing protein
MNIARLMTSSPVTCRSTSTLHDAARLMWECNVGTLPVVDPDGRLLGVLTDRDVCLSAYDRDQPLRTIAVGTVMSERAFACAPDDTAEQAADVMARHGLRRLPVVDPSGQLLGIVSIDDLAGAAMRPGADLSEHVVTATLATIAGTAPGPFDDEC